MGKQLIITDGDIAEVTDTTLKTEPIRKSRLFGYRHTKGKVIINEEQAKTIKLIYKLALDDYSNKAIAKELNKIGMKPARNREFTEGIVKSYLEEIRYIGVKDYPQIISKEDFLEVNKNIKIKMET